MKSDKKILLVEDDPNFGRILKDYLTINNYEVTLAANGIEGFEKFNKSVFDLCILDIMMPFKDGLTLAKEIKEVNDAIPLIFLTAKNLKDDVLKGYKIGADDYLTKPFSLNELIARSRALIRRSKRNKKNIENSKTVIEFNHIKMFLEECRVTSFDREITLSPKEFKLLELFMKNPKRVWSRDLILEKIWEIDFIGDTKTVDVHVRWLREKLEEDPSAPKFLKTVRGFGYKFG